MKRGDLFRVRKPGGDPKRSRVFVVVSRRTVIESRLSTVICAPVMTQRGGLSTEVDIGPSEGLEHASSIHCDLLMSIPKAHLTDYVGELRLHLLTKLDHALRVALAVD